MSERENDRLYDALPGYIRAADAEEGRPLQALMRILGAELKLVEDDIDALYDNWFIETCEDWVVPYIADLVGARMLREFGEGSLRAYVANALSYRQAKGTIAVLEQLARDVTGWPAVGVEFFRRLIQTQNVNHVRMSSQGTVCIRDADLAARVGGPFEAAAHSPDLRDVGQGLGRYNIPNVGLFVWRIPSFALPFVTEAADGYLGGVVPRAAGIGPGFRHLDPVGRPLRLFNRARTEGAVGQLAAEANVPAPLRTRTLAADLDALRRGEPGSGAYFLTRPVLRVRLGGAEVPPEQLHCCNLEDRVTGASSTWNRPAQAGHVHFDPELGRLSLHSADEGRQVEVAHAFGAPSTIGGGPANRRADAAAWLEPLAAKDDPAPLWQIGVTRRAEEITDLPEQGGPVVGSVAEAILAWNRHAVPGARGIIALLDSATYDEPMTSAAHVIRIPAGARLAIVAAGWPKEPLGAGAFGRKPGRLVLQDRRPHVVGNLRVRGEGAPGEGGTLIVDGLLLEGRVEVTRGVLGRIELRAGTYGAGIAGLGRALRVQEANAGLDIVIDHSVVGLIEAGEAAGRATIRDSILGEERPGAGSDAAAPVLATPGADLLVMRTTVFGAVAGRTIEADDSLFTRPLTIARRQEGCLRFSFVPAGSRVPRRYRCAPDLQIALARQTLGAAFGAADEQAIRECVQPAFTSTASEDFAFAQLARRCPPEIAEGGEDGREMGAMNALALPLRAANLRDALEEYLPLGLSAGIIYQT